MAARIEDNRYLERLMAERARRHELQRRVRDRPVKLHDFVRAAWPLVVPNAAFVDNWHVGAICEHLTAQSEGQLPRLCINVPPGSSKSTTVCVLWPAWEWTLRPGIQWQFSAYADTLAVRDSLRCRLLVEQMWYRELYGDVWQPNRRAWLADRFENDKGGIRQSVSVGGSPTGFHCHRQIVDDPIKPIDAHSALALARCRMWWWETMASRVLPGASNTRTIIMQRLHDRDLAGEAAEQDYAVLSIPMVYSRKATRAATPLGWLDPRKSDGELLCPARWSEAEVARRKREFGPEGWSSQDQQDPVPEGGAIYHTEWMQHRYHVLPRLDAALLVLSFDCAFKADETSSYVAGQVWAYLAPRFYLLDEVRDHLDFLGTIAAIETLYRKWPACSAVLIEDKANGPAVMDVLRNRIPGIIPIEPEGSKIARAYSTQPVFASGSVHLPHHTVAPWIEDWVVEHTRFPRGAANDRVDAQSQALRWLTAGIASGYLQALDEISL